MKSLGSMHLRAFVLYLHPSDCGENYLIEFKVVLFQVKKLQITLIGFLSGFFLFINEQNTMNMFCDGDGGKKKL